MLQLNFFHFTAHGNYEKKQKQLEKDNNDAEPAIPSNGQQKTWRRYS
jgi:hypothetical protein